VMMILFLLSIVQSACRRLLVSRSLVVSSCSCIGDSLLLLVSVHFPESRGLPRPPFGSLLRFAAGLLLFALDGHNGTVHTSFICSLIGSGFTSASTPVVLTLSDQYPDHLLDSASVSSSMYCYRSMATVALSTLVIRADAHSDTVGVAMDQYPDL
jgi:hypothetical protein